MTPKEYCALDIFSNYLTSSLSSILYDELREKRQLIYSISSYIYQISNNFLFSIVFNCKKDTARINKCISIITKILKSFYKNGITSKEFNKFKIKSISDYEYHRDRTQDEILNYIRMYYMNLPKINYIKYYSSIINSFLKKTVCNKLKGSKKFIFIV
jgi:predicted Zn-dependent peptidase